MKTKRRIIAFLFSVLMVWQGYSLAKAEGEMPLFIEGNYGADIRNKTPGVETLGAEITGNEVTGTVTLGTEIKGIEATGIEEAENKDNGLIDDSIAKDSSDNNAEIDIEHDSSESFPERNIQDGEFVAEDVNKNNELLTSEEAENNDIDFAIPHRKHEFFSKELVDGKIHEVEDTKKNIHYFLEYIIRFDAKKTKIKIDQYGFSELYLEDILESNALSYYDSDYTRDYELTDAEKYSPSMRIGFWKSGNFQEDTNGKKHFVPSEDEENHPGAFVSLRSDREGKTPATKQRAYLQYKQVEDFSASNTFRHNLYYLSEDEGIELRYFVEIHEPPVKGKSYKNSARMMDIDMEPRDTTFTVKEDLPSAKDNLYRIKILKTDKADGRPLSGAQFLISKKYSRFEKIIESNIEGIAYADNLLPGDYLVREIEPPDGYLARRRNIEVETEKFNENREVTIPLQNERRNPNTLDIIVEKKWLRLVKPGTPSPATLLPDLSFPGSFLDISLPAEDAVLDSDKPEAEYKEEEEEEENLTQPDSITIYLLKNGERDETRKVNLPFNTDWVHVFTDLPRRDENGNEIKYSIEELNIPGYSTAIAGSQDTKFTITNYPDNEGLTAIPVTKIWKGKGPHPKFLEVYLLSKGTIIETVELSAKNDWQHTFIVSKTDSENNKIEYSIKEKEVEGYNSKTEHNEKTGYINVLINEKPEEENTPEPPKGNDNPPTPGTNENTPPKPNDNGGSPPTPSGGGNTPGNPGGGGSTPPRVVERPPVNVITPPPSTTETPGEVLGANRTTPSNMTEPSPQVLGVDRAKVLGQGRGWTKTSDSSAVYLYLSFFLLSLTALSFVLIQKKRNKESKR